MTGNFGGMRLLVAAVALVMLVACGGGSSKNQGATNSNSAANVGGVAQQGGDLAWPAPPTDQVASLVAAAGLALETHESLVHHVHAHLDVFVDGAHRTVPGGIGIVITDPGVRTSSFDGQPAYGGIAECAQPCISPLHTHGADGILHTESLVATDNTLGQFFTQWDVRLDDTCIGDFCSPDTALAVYVNGTEVPFAQAAAIPLTDHKEIAVVIGTPPKQIPSEADFSQA